MRYRDLLARVYKQEAKNLALHEGSRMGKLVLVNPDDARTKSAVNVSMFSLSKPFKYMHFSHRVKIVKLYQKKNKQLYLYIQQHRFGVASFVLVVFAYEVIVSPPLRSTLKTFTLGHHLGRALKSLCTVISHGRALLSC